jgi:hypothetical protein
LLWIRWRSPGVAPTEAEAGAEARTTVRSPLEMAVRVCELGTSEVARARRRGVESDDGLGEERVGVGDGWSRAAAERVGWMEGCEGAHTQK